MADSLLDTGLLIHFLRGNPKAAGLLAPMLSSSVVSISVVTVTEILVGSRDERHRTAAHSAFVLVRILPIDKDIAEKAALLIQRYPRLFGKGISRGTADAFIGATAWSLGLPLYTLNTRHFAKIPIAEIQIRAIDQTTPDWL